MTQAMSCKSSAAASGESASCAMRAASTRAFCTRNAPASTFATLSRVDTNQPTRSIMRSKSRRVRARSVALALFSMTGTMRPMAVSGVRIWCDTSASASASAPFSCSNLMPVSRRVATILESWFFRMAKSPSR